LLAGSPNWTPAPKGEWFGEISMANKTLKVNFDKTAVALGVEV
jgi:hypothetical protein